MRLFASFCHLYHLLAVTTSSSSSSSSADIHSGTALDWYASEGSRFSYVTELRDMGYSFLLPPEQIIPSGEEMWAAFEVIIKKIIEVSPQQPQ